jgi:hypothetical protein
VFDNQHSLWTNVFASVYVCSSQDDKLLGLRHGGKQHLKDQVKINKYQAKSKKRRQVLPHTDCPVEDTGLSGRGHRTVRCHTSDSPVHQGTVAQRLVPGGTGGEKPPYCLV